VSCGESTVTSAGSSDAFVARFSELDGRVESFLRYGGSLPDAGLGLVANGSDRWTAVAYIDNTYERALEPFWHADGLGITLVGSRGVAP
jgi:hypothetical protein